MSSYGGFNGFDLMDSILPFIVIAIFSIVFIGFAVVIIGGIKEWGHNNKQPILNVDAEIVSKRGHTSRHTHDDHTSTSTTYYVTFQVQSGDRMEFRVPGKEYGLLAEGDKGNLIFQGTRYHGFDREI